MRRITASWVPPGAWLAPGYAEWQAPAALRGPVACLWSRLVPESGHQNVLVLPEKPTPAKVTEPPVIFPDTLTLAKME